jgi:putative ABC transport system permease protein
MLTTYFKTALRTLWRNKIFSAINIAGLSVGISAALVIFLIARYDFNFDKDHPAGTRIYRITSWFNFSGEIYKNPGVPYPAADALRKEATGIEIIAPVVLWNENQKMEIPVKQGTPLKLKRKSVPVFADSSYFRLVRYKWLAGNPSSALEEPRQVVLTEKKAAQLFPDSKAADIIGKEIIFDDTVHTKVNGVVQDLPYHTDFSSEIFISRSTLIQTTLQPRSWTEWNNVTDASQVFVQLSAGTNPDKIRAQADYLLNKYQKKETEDKSSQQQFKMQPLSDLHFNAELGNFSRRTAHKPTLYGLLTVAIFLLLLGCINFINLTTAQGAQRAKEIGIRKTLGGSRAQLIRQIITETFLVTLIATGLSVLITPILLKIFSDFIPEGLSFSFSSEPFLWIFLAALLIGITLLAGFYPAWVLTGHKPVDVIKNHTNSSGQSRKAWVRKSLTVSQFTIAQFLVLATFVVGQQIHYTLNKDLGFKKEAILFFTVNYRDTSYTKKKVLLHELNRIPGIQQAALSNGTPVSDNSWSSTITFKNGKQDINTDVQMKFGDSSYLRQFGLRLVAGNNIRNSDTVREVLINETYAKLLGFRKPSDAVGRSLTWDGKQQQICGVLADFHFQSLHQPIKPIILGGWNKISRVFAVTLQPRNIDGSNWKTSIDAIEQAWKKLYPDDDFDYHFLDEIVARNYESEQHISSLLRWATGLAIGISCLGLLGLVMYTTLMRTREIGIRKVLGATVTQITTLLSKDFLVLVGIAFLIASPVAWWAMQQWLNNFAYRINMNPLLFVLAGMVTMGAAIITMSFQTIRAAMTNPVESLRTE